MKAVEILRLLLERYDYSAPLKELPYPDEIAFLTRLGLARVERSLSNVLCNACDLDHVAKIVTDPETNKIGWHCPEAGFVSATDADLEAVRVDPVQLVALLADALDCHRRRSTPLIDDRLWRVGSFEFARDDITIFLALHIQDLNVANAISEKLSSEPGLRRGLPLTPNFSGAMGVSITRCRVASLDELISLSEDGIVAKQHHAVGLAGVQVKRVRGAPEQSRRSEAETLARQRIANGQTEFSVRAEARAIMRLMGEGAPGPTTLRGIVSDARGDQ